MKLLILQEDIDLANSLRSSGEPLSGRCPIAQAAKRQGHPDAWVLDEWVRLSGSWHHLPLEARVLVEHFDTRQPVEPTTLNL
jgi:hypothetical protein